MNDVAVAYTPQQARKYLGVSRSTISRWEATGLLPFFVTPGGHHRYLKTDLDALKNDPPKRGRPPKPKAQVADA